VNTEYIFGVAPAAKEKEELGERVGYMLNILSDSKLDCIGIYIYTYIYMYIHTYMHT